MVILTVAVVLVAAVTLLNLLLTLGLVRRLRVHADQLNKLGKSSAADPGRIPVGTAIEPFTATTLDGLQVSPTSGTVLGFFSTSCTACAVHLPSFLTYAEPRGREHVIAVVQGDEPGLTELTEKLSKVAQVVVETSDGPVQRAVGVRAMPTFLVLGDDLRVVASGYQAAQLTT